MSGALENSLAVFAPIRIKFEELARIKPRNDN